MAKQDGFKLNELPDFPADGPVVMKRISFGGVKTKLQALQGGRAKKNNTKAVKTSAHSVIPAGKKLGLGKTKERLGKFVKAYFTVSEAD